MINVRTIKKLTNNEGLTIKAGKVITYKSGWQVADYGVEAHTPEDQLCISYHCCYLLDFVSVLYHMRTDLSIPFGKNNYLFFFYFSLDKLLGLWYNGNQRA